MTSTYSFLDPAVQLCPFPTYDVLREQGPIYHDPQTGWYFVLDYALARKLTADNINLSNDTGFLFTRTASDHVALNRIWDSEGFRPVPALVVTDPPLHTFHRAFIDKAFTPARVAKMEAYLESVVDDILSPLMVLPEIDFKQQIAITVPLVVIADQLGMPRADLATFKRWSAAVLEYLDPSLSPLREQALAHEICELHRYTERKVAEYRAQPADCLLSDFANTEVDGKRLSMPEIATIVVQVLTGGNDSTANALANGIYRLCEDPALQQQLREEPARIPQFVEEVLRLDAPVQGLFRRVINEITVAGVTLPKDAMLVLKWGAANRDSAQFACPHQVDLARPNARNHLTFGFGPHTCVGANLTRGEMRLTFARMLQQSSTIRLARGAASVEREPHFFAYGFRHLWIALERR